MIVIVVIVVVPAIPIVVLTIPMAFMQSPAFTIVIVVRMKPICSFVGRTLPLLPPPTGSDVHPGPNTPQSKRSPGLESAHAAPSATEVVGFRCTPQSVPKQGW